MWSLKLKALRQRKKIRHNPVVISKLMVVALPLLLALLWYPDMSALHHTTNLLQQSLEKTLRQQMLSQSDLINAKKLSWLNDYAWLTWRLEEANREGRVEQQKTKAHTVKLFLDGINNDVQWRRVIDRLFDVGYFQPISTAVAWQLDGQIRVALTLERASKAFELPLLVVPKRIYTAWPKGMMVSTALYWDNEWRASLDLAGDTLYLRQGLWIPELAATLTNIDAKSVTFRQQFSSSKQTNARLHKVSSTRGIVNSIEKKIYYIFAREGIALGPSNPDSHRLAQNYTDKTRVMQTIPGKMEQGAIGIVEKNAIEGVRQ